MFAAGTVSHQLWNESVVQLAAEHLLLVLRQLHLCVLWMWMKGGIVVLRAQKMTIAIPVVGCTVCVQV